MVMPVVVQGDSMLKVTVVTVAVTVDIIVRAAVGRMVLVTKFNRRGRLPDLPQEERPSTFISFHSMVPLSRGSLSLMMPSKAS